MIGKWNKTSETRILPLPTFNSLYLITAYIYDNKSKHTFKTSTQEERRDLARSATNCCMHTECIKETF